MKAKKIHITTKLLRFTSKKDKNYYKSLNEKDASDNKTFWKSSETFPFGQDSFKRANDETISEDSKIAESLNSFFSNIVKNLKIPEYRLHNDSLFENVSNPIFKAILKYNILNIGQLCRNKSNKQPLFSFSQTTRDEILKEILSLDTTKACQVLIHQERYLKEN